MGSEMCIRDRGVLRNFPISSIDYDKRTRRAKVEISLCGEPKTLTLSVEGDGSEEAVV